jgi:hypothetical protein
MPLFISYPPRSIVAHVSSRPGAQRRRFWRADLCRASGSQRPDSGSDAPRRRISLRGYEAARLIEAAGHTNVEVMEGGILAWPYPREKQDIACCTEEHRERVIAHLTQVILGAE